MLKCLHNANEILTLESALNKDGRMLSPQDADIISKSSIVYNNEEILWVGSSDSIPADYSDAELINCENMCIVPEIVDSHTHLVFSGNRSKEYTMRLNGADYEAIAKAGGGILNTMSATKDASEQELFDSGIKRIEQIASYGIGSIEIKSGYGLTLESERKISNVIARLKNHFAPKIQILNTYLAAHAVPKEYNSSKEYIDSVVLPLLNELAVGNVIDFVDIFHERGYFSLEDTITLFKAAQKHGIKIKIHADEFNDNKGALTATQFGAISADHLLCTGEDGIKALAASETVATILPGTALFLDKPMAPARKLLDAGCKVAIASDFNPGSCHCDNLLMLTSISAKKLKMNAAEAWCAITLNSAHALNLKNQGAVIKGLKPRFSFFNANTIDEVIYSWGKNLALKPNYLNF